jgi:uncharacterized membrane protein HdeD (DUF308 family)
MPRTDDSTALASNWRTVLAVDAALGVVVLVAGLATIFMLNAVFGVAMVVVGVAYLALIGSRTRRWLRLRREANL